MESEIIGELARSGLLGILLALAIWELSKKDKALADAYQKRVEDVNRLSVVIEATNTASRALETTSENRSRVIESIGEATRATAEAIKSQAIILDQVRQTAEKNNHALNMLRDECDKLLIELKVGQRVTKGPVRR